MRAIILAAGQSKRFSEAGFPLPKYLLHTPDGRTVIETIVDNLTKAGHDDIVFIGREEDKKAMRGTVLKILNTSKEPLKFSFDWLSRKEQAAGPLGTAWAARAWMDNPFPVLLHYCDVLADAPTLAEFEFSANTHEAALVVFESEDARFTRVPDSELCASGIFYFKRASDFIRRTRFAPKGTTNGIPDIVYGYEDWFAFLSHEIVDLGVPQDYRNWMAANGKPLKPWA